MTRTGPFSVVNCMEGTNMGLKSILIIVVIALAAIYASNHVTFVKNIVG